MQRNLYAIIGVPKTATPEEIRKAYRTIVQASHPDRAVNDPDARARYEEATTAYKVLNDPAMRRRYDVGHADIKTVTDLFLRNSAGQKLLRLVLPTAPAESQDGPDRLYAVSAKAELLRQGGSFPFSMPLANGESLEIVLAVPSGTRPYTTCRFERNGHPGKNGGSPGDLYLIFLPDEEK